MVMKVELFTQILEQLIESYSIPKYGNLRKSHLWQEEMKKGWRYGINYDDGFGSTRTLFITLYYNGRICFGDISGFTGRIYKKGENIETAFEQIFGFKNNIPKFRITRTIDYLLENSENPSLLFEKFLKDGTFIHTEKEIKKIREYLKAA